MIAVHVISMAREIEALHDVANAVGIAGETNVALFDGVAERDPVRQQRGPCPELKFDLELSSRTVGWNRNTPAHMKAGSGAVVENEAEVVVDPCGPFGDEQHSKGGDEDVGWAAHHVAMREPVGPEPTHVALILEFERSGQRPVAEVC